MGSHKAKIDRIVRRVWDNTTFPFPTPAAHRAAKFRYRARAYSSGGSGWGIWDQKDQKFIEGAAIAGIDPDEAWVN
jgi:hypothetical protein